MPSQSVSTLLGAIGLLLRPVVRLCIHYGLTFPIVADVLKRVYLDVAERELSGPGTPPTDSRLSLLTGIHRKYVKPLRGDGSFLAPLTTPKHVSLGAQIAAVWNHRAEFLDREGAPRALPRVSPEPGAPSFEMLVQCVSRDIRPKVVLDEWLRLGVVTQDAGGDVVLNSEVFLPASGFDEKVFYLGRNLHDHAATVENNLVAAGPPMLERCVHYEYMNEAACREVSRVAEKAAMKAVREVNGRVLRGGAGVAPDGVPWRMNFGVFFYMAPQAGQGSAGRPAPDQDGHSDENTR